MRLRALCLCCWQSPPRIDLEARMDCRSWWSTRGCRISNGRTFSSSQSRVLIRNLLLIIGKGILSILKKDLCIACHLIVGLIRTKQYRICHSKQTLGLIKKERVFWESLEWRNKKRHSNIYTMLYSNMGYRVNEFYKEII